MPPKHKSFKDVMMELADSSSLHGVGKITSSRHLPVKILWCLLFLAAFALLVRQMVDLFSTFYSHPIQTSISIKFSPLQLPAVTICNMNAVRNSKLQLSPKLEKLSASFKVKVLKKEPINLTDIGTITPPQLLNPTPPLGPCSQPAEPSNSQPAEPSSSQPAEPSSSQPVEISSSQPAESSSSQSAEPSSSQPAEPSSSQVDKTSSSQIDPSSVDESSSPVPPSTISPTSSSQFNSYQDAYVSSTYFDLFNPFNVYNSEYISKSILKDALEKDLQFLKDQLLAERDKWSDRIIKMMSYLKQENQTTRRMMGHQSNMIQSVSFSGVVQNTSTVQAFSDPEYGNCYTLSDPKKFVALRSGPGHGLKITLNVEIDEYVHSFITSPGIKVVLHTPGTLPLPSEEGIILNPATETNVGLKAVSVKRLGEPYAECTDGLEFEQKYKFKYSVPACLALCRAKRIMDACKCIPSDSPDIELNTTALPVCNSTKTSVNNVCVKREDIKFDDDHVFCHCDNSCSEIIYSSTISSRGWPGDNFLNELLDEVCEEDKDLESMKVPCTELENNDLDYDRYRQNFLQILVYFEDLNYESITQEPMYEPVRFLSDIGGACGLFLGASVLSFVEFLQLLMEICLYIYHKGRDRARSKVKDVMIAQKVIAGFKPKTTSTIRQIDVSS